MHGRNIGYGYGLDKNSKNVLEDTMSDIINIKFNRKTFEIEDITEVNGDCHSSCKIDCNKPIDVASLKKGESVKRIGTITVFDGSRICFVFNGSVFCTNV